jgi:sRNA-binding regulator protein Hfq
MKYWLVLLGLFTSIGLSAQSVENVIFLDVGDDIVITYNLKGNDLYEIECSYTLDGGETFLPIKTATGDIGADISSGKNKVIKWDVFADLNGIEGEIQFKVEAKAQNESQQFYTNIKLGFNDSYMFSLQFGYFGKRKLGFGFSYQNSDYKNHKDASSLIYKHVFSPIVSLKLIDLNKYQLIGSIQSGISINQEEEIVIRIFDNFNIDLRQNFGDHFQLILGFAIASYKYDFYEGENDISEKLRYFNYGIGYNF